MTPTPETVDLLPCPHCGSSNVQSGGDDKVVGVWCWNCGATGPNGYLTINGDFDWNTRAALPVQEGWQPIETAPRDGSVILGWHPTCVVTPMLYFEDEGWGGRTANDAKLLVKFPPTFWMPLPEPPAGETP